MQNAIGGDRPKADLPQGVLLGAIVHQFAAQSKISAELRPRNTAREVQGISDILPKGSAVKDCQWLSENITMAQY